MCVCVPHHSVEHYPPPPEWLQEGEGEPSPGAEGVARGGGGAEEVVAASVAVVVVVVGGGRGRQQGVGLPAKLWGNKNEWFFFAFRKF